MARDPYPSETQDRFLLRLPDGMRERLKAEAEANKRSMNAEIVARLDLTFDLVSQSAPDARAELIDLLKKAEAQERASSEKYEQARQEYEEARIAAETQTQKMTEFETYLKSMQDYMSALKIRHDELTKELKKRRDD